MNAACCSAGACACPAAVSFIKMPAGTPPMDRSQSIRAATAAWNSADVVPAFGGLKLPVQSIGTFIVPEMTSHERAISFRSAVLNQPPRPEGVTAASCAKQVVKINAHPHPKRSVMFAYFLLNYCGHLRYNL